MLALFTLRVKKPAGIVSRFFFKYTFMTVTPFAVLSWLCICHDCRKVASYALPHHTQHTHTHTRMTHDAHIIPLCLAALWRNKTSNITHPRRHTYTPFHPYIHTHSLRFSTTTLHHLYLGGTAAAKASKIIILHMSLFRREWLEQVCSFLL